MLAKLPRWGADASLASRPFGRDAGVGAPFPEVSCKDPRAS